LFEGGGVLDHNAIEEIPIDSLKQTFQGEWINCIDKELGLWLLMQLNLHPEAFCLFEDIMQSTTDPHVDLYNFCGICYKNEIYYLVSTSNKTIDLIDKCIQEVRMPWHFLCILFQGYPLN